jgi:hypothetical protein
MCDCGKPTAGAVLCPSCQPTLAIAIANVSAYYEDLTTISTKAARYGSQGATKGSLGKAQPLPVDTRFLDVTGDGTQVRYDVWASVVAWCKVVMEDQPEVSGPVCADCIHGSCALIRRRRWPRNTIRSMCAYFDRQFRWIIREEWAASFLDEMLDNERRLCRMVDRPADRWYAGRCSAADEHGVCAAELYAVADKGSVTCRACETVHDIATRREFLLTEAKDYYVTATEAAVALLAWTDYDGSETKLVDRIRKWRDREVLDVRDVTSLAGRDRHLYRLGDIQELMVDAAQHAQRKHLDRAG